MHVRVDLPPHVLEDEIGLKLVAPDQSWRQRPDMDPHNLSRARASVVSRARFKRRGFSSSNDLTMVRADANTGFLKVDLDIFSNRDLQPLLAA
jgi:hypothetical protein